MKTGHERNQESLNWLFNSRKLIKSGYNTKVDRLIDEMYEQHFITEEDLNVAKQKKYTDEEINQLEKNYVDFRNTNSWDDMKRIIKETVGIIKSSRRPIKSEHVEGFLIDYNNPEADNYIKELNDYCYSHQIQLQVNEFKQYIDITLDNQTFEERKEVEKLISKHANILESEYLAGGGRWFRTVLKDTIVNSRRPIKSGRPLLSRYEVERMIIKSSYLTESDAEWIESAGKWKAMALAGILALGLASPAAAKTKKIANQNIDPQQKIDQICDAMTERGDTTIYLWDDEGELTDEGKALQKALGELGRDDGFGFGPGVKSFAIELANHGITLVNEDGKPIMKADGGFSW